MSCISTIFRVDRDDLKDACSLSVMLVVSCLIGVLSYLLLDYPMHWFNPILVYQRFNVLEFAASYPEQLEIGAIWVLIDSLLNKAQEVSFPVLKSSGDNLLALFQGYGVAEEVPQTESKP